MRTYALPSFENTKPLSAEILYRFGADIEPRPARSIPELASTNGYVR
jgi:hypothetical protein